MANDGLLTPAARISLFTSFRAFWNEVETARASALAGAVPVMAREPALTHAGTAIRARLVAALKAQEAEVSRVTHGAALQSYREAQYLMTALADDVFVRLPWDGAEWWLWNPLEKALFGTRCAGRRVFERLEQLTAEADPDRRELAAVYLAALALGFEGEYAGRADLSPIEEYRRRLRVFIFGDREPFQEALVPQCYAHTETPLRGPLLGSARVWWWAALVVIVAWLAASSVAWRQVTQSVAMGAARIDTALAAPGEATR